MRCGQLRRDSRVVFVLADVTLRDCCRWIQWYSIASNQISVTAYSGCDPARLARSGVAPNALRLATSSGPVRSMCQGVVGMPHLIIFFNMRVAAAGAVEGGARGKTWRRAMSERDDSMLIVQYALMMTR